jgi:acyl carrier protein
MSIETEVRTLLLPVFGLGSIDEIGADQSLVRDLGADSIDFVEIVYIVEKAYKVKIETKEIVSGGSGEALERMFNEGALTLEGVAIIRGRMPYKPERFKPGMTKMEIFQSITVMDLVNLIEAKRGSANAAG